MTIILVIAGYVAFVGICVSFLQFAHGRDEAMHTITTQWIENESGALE